jgi:hypothetical protein
MLAVLYQARVIPGKETVYVDCWRAISSYLKGYRGALGSTIHKEEMHGLWVIYSRWPDWETKEKSWPAEGEKDLPQDILEMSERMIECVEEM